MLGLCCCTGLSSSHHEWGLFSGCNAQASHCSGFRCCGIETLGCVWPPGSRALLLLPLLLLPSVLPSIRVFSTELVLCIRWPKYWSFSFSISPSNEYSGLISFSIDWSDLLAVQGTLKSLLQHHNSKASILRHSAFFMVQLSHPYTTARKTIALTIQSFVGKVMSLLF